MNKDATNNERQTVEKNLNMIQRIYKELNVAVVCISSLNRLTYGQPIKKSSFKETGQIEYDAAVLIGLQGHGMHKLDGLSDKERVKVASEMGLGGPAKKNEDGSVSCELVIVKNRKGENAGWATNKYIQTGQWIFSQRIDRKCGRKAFLTAITEPTQAGNPSPQHGEGRWVWVDVEWSQYQGRWFPRVKRVYPPNTYQPMAKDFCIATDHWGKGSNSVNHAVALANYSPYPVLLADTQEKNSPMNQYCEENHICVVPISGMPGDYMRPNGRIIVDRKDSLSELYHNFFKGTSWASYAVAAQLAGAEGKKLVFVIAVDPGDNVRCLNDLSGWQGRLPDETIVKGAKLLEQLKRYHKLFHNTRFYFVLRHAQGAAIWRLVSA